MKLSHYCRYHDSRPQFHAKKQTSSSGSSSGAKPTPFFSPGKPARWASLIPSEASLRPWYSDKTRSPCLPRPCRCRLSLSRICTSPVPVAPPSLGVEGGVLGQDGGFPLLPPPPFFRFGSDRPITLTSIDPCSSLPSSTSAASDGSARSGGLESLDMHDSYAEGGAVLSSSSCPMGHASRGLRTRVTCHRCMHTQL